MIDAETAGARRARSWIIAPLLTVGLLLPLFAATAYYRMFSAFSWYDDEGYMLVMIDQVHRGKVLGDEVFAQYGPAYPLTYDVVYKLTGLEVNNDSIRMITVMLWLLTAMACSYVYSVTGSLAVSLVVLWLAFQAGAALISEPGHPQGIVTFAAAMIPVVAVALLPTRKTLFCAIAGALVGYLLMCKVNVGLFALAALVLTLVAATPGGLARRLTWLLVAGAILAPILLLWAHLDTIQGARLAIVTAMGSAAIGAQVIVRRPQFFSLRDWGWTLAGLLATIIAACGTAALSGNSLRALADMVLLTAIKHPNVIFKLLMPHGIVIVLAIVSLAVSLLVCLSERFPRLQRPASLSTWTLRAVLVGWALKYWFLENHIHIPSFTLLDHLPISDGAIPLLWLGLAPAVEPISITARLIRCLLVCIAAFHVLVIYPVTGNHIGMAHLLIMPVVGLVLHDIITGVVALLPASSRKPLSWIGVGAVTLVLLAAGCVQLVHGRNTYLENTPLDLSGAWRLRLTKDAVARYRFLVANLNSPERDFLTLPGLNSLYFWSQKQPPVGLNSLWILQLSDAQQKRVIAAVKDKHDLWAVTSVPLTLRWTRGQNQNVDEKPLVRFIRSDCREVNSVGGIELRARATHASTELLQCVHWHVANALRTEDGAVTAWRECRMSLGFAHQGLLGAIAVVDPETGKVLACSQPTPSGPGKIVLSIHNMKSSQPDTPSRTTPLSLDGLKELRFTVSFPKSMNTSGFLVVGLLSPAGKWLDFLPFLDTPDLTETADLKETENL